MVKSYNFEQVQEKMNFEVKKKVLVRAFVHDRHFLPLI